MTGQRFDLLEVLIAVGVIISVLDLILGLLRNDVNQLTGGLVGGGLTLNVILLRRDRNRGTRD